MAIQHEEPGKQTQVSEKSSGGEFSKVSGTLYASLKACSLDY
jgi:hypothetical protein